MHHHHGSLGGLTLTENSMLLKIAMAIAASSIVIKELLFRATKAIGERINSQVQERGGAEMHLTDQVMSHLSCVSLPLFFFLSFFFFWLRLNPANQRDKGISLTLSLSFAFAKQVLIANAWHHRSDAYTSVVSLVGLAGSNLGRELGRGSSTSRRKRWL